jgi:hypothetical protein
VSADRSRPILHIGYHKTGSSWLQQQLFPKAEGVSLVPRREIRRELLIPTPLVFDPDRAREKLVAGRSGRLAISEEELSGNLHTGGLHGAFSLEIADRLHRCFPEAQVVIFIREQKSMVAAAYKQYIKSGGTRCIEAFLTPAKSPHKTPNFSLDFLAYDHLVAEYEERFGRENVSVFLYEELATRPRELVARLRDELALDLDPAAVSIGAVNPGYRSRTLALLRFLNLFHNREMPNTSCIVHIPGLYPLLRAMSPRVDRLPFMGRVQELGDFLSEPEVQALADRFRESNARLEGSRALELREFGYALP